MARADGPGRGTPPAHRTLVHLLSVRHAPAHRGPLRHRPAHLALVVPPSQQRPGPAAYVRKAVHANAARLAGGGTDFRRRIADPDSCGRIARRFAPYTGLGAELRRAGPLPPRPRDHGPAVSPRRLAALGAATDPIPFRSLTTERPADSLDRVVEQRADDRAAARAAKHLAAESGAGRTLRTIQQMTDGGHHSEWIRISPGTPSGVRSVAAAR
jgi:hypothetical protein